MRPRAGGWELGAGAKRQNCRGPSRCKFAIAPSRVCGNLSAMQNQGLTGLSFLVVEDEPLLRKQAGAFLERLGADVTLAETIDRARRLIQDLSFDFALLDVNLPDG